uniref:DUF8040 domain-containing protein n=1 Tax=Cajanus cajan TaxID=3821 RepID=A0A151SU16_CAJCA|nr:hypothetical protein KK1_004559 [Cajanus cajan]
MEKASYVNALVSEYAIKYLCKEPCRTSEHTCYSCMHEILQVHLVHYYEIFRMEKHIFHKLCTYLANHGLMLTNCMRVEEMVTMFLKKF